MADILRIGLSGLLAQQRALATTANNIANASTPGYSRQRVELTERPLEMLGNGGVGTGVQVALNRRLTDDLMADQLRFAAGSFSRADAFVQMAEALDELLAGGGTGLSATLQSFTNAVQELADDPASTSARQVLISAARTLVARFETMDRRMSELSNEVGARLVEATSEINSLGQGIADINAQILGSGGQPPADLLDQRDRMLERLSELVQVETATQRDGTLSVFIGSGQALVVGTTATQLAVTPGSTDPQQPRIVLRGGGPDVDVTPFLTGGALGGTLDFNREMLSPARAELGRIAAGLVDTFNTMHRNGMDLDGDLGGDFFAIAAPQSFGASTNTGTGAVTATITNTAALQPTNYRLSFDGTNYLLTRTDNGASVTMTGAGTSASPFVADGVSFVVSGAPAAGDQFLIKPLEHVAGSLQLLVTNTADVAAAAPTRTTAALSNVGSGTISAGEVIDPTVPGFPGTATIDFIDSSTYSINGVGTFTYTPGADIDVGGTRVRIDGAPAAGDRFVIQPNTGGAGDNRNALRLAAALSDNVFDGNLTLQGAAGRLVTSVGSRTAEVTSQRNAQGAVLDQTRQRLDSVRGVNLDEEAADMLRFQQLYQAAAQTIAVADTLFNTLLAALRR